MFRHNYGFMELFLSKYQCGFRLRYSAQHCLLAMIVNWKLAIDKGDSFGAQKSKVFDCLPQNSS